MSDYQDRREEILVSSAELFARKGVSATTIREIAVAVGVTSGTLYHYFTSKDAILSELITAYLDDLLSQYREFMTEELDSRSRLHGLVIVSLRTAEKNPYATQIYQRDLVYLRELSRHKECDYPQVKAAVAEIQRTWLKVIQDGREHGVFRNDIPSWVFYRLMRDAVWLSTKWHRQRGDYGVEQLAQDCTSIFLDGFAVEREQPRPHRPSPDTKLTETLIE